MSEDIILIRSLLQAKRVDIYDLHKKYKLSPAQLSSSMKKLISEDVVYVDNGFVSFTETGQEWVLNNRSQIFLNQNNRFWSNIDSRYKYQGSELDDWDYYKSIMEILIEGEV